MQRAKQSAAKKIGAYLGPSLAGGQKQNAKLEVRSYPAVKGATCSPRDLVKGQWWRLVSSFFDTWGIIHIAVNLSSPCTLVGLL